MTLPEFDLFFGLPVPRTEASKRLIRMLREHYEVADSLSIGEAWLDAIRAVEDEASEPLRTHTSKPHRVYERVLGDLFRCLDCGAAGRITSTPPHWLPQPASEPLPAAGEPPRETEGLDAVRWLASLHEDANGLVWTTKDELRAVLEAAVRSVTPLEGLRAAVIRELDARIQPMDWPDGMAQKVLAALNAALVSTPASPETSREEPTLAELQAQQADDNRADAWVDRNAPKDFR